jgi:hypothetical protein
MNLTQKYNLKIEFDQGGNSHNIDDHFQDHGESLLLNFFEKICLKIKSEKSNASMIELGANWSYYSLLFKHIIGKNNTFNIMLEADPEALKRGIHNFSINSCEGTFLNKMVGNEIYRIPELDMIPCIQLENLCKEYNLNHIDILHSDIDCSEFDMLNQNKAFFEKKIAKYLFLLTHSEDLHNKCFEFLKNLKYDCILNHKDFNIGGQDALLIFEG